MTEHCAEDRNQLMGHVHGRLPKPKITAATITMEVLTPTEPNRRAAQRRSGTRE